MDFLKKLTTPTFYLASYAQGVAQFRCSKSLKPQTSTDGNAILPGGARCELTILITDAQSGVYAGQVTGPKESISLLERTFLPDGKASKEQMFYKPTGEDMTRHARTYAMRSRAFHNFQGVTAELSRAGAMVMLTGPVEPGIDLSVQIVLDDEELKPMDLDGTVEWCSQRDPKTWIACLAFKPLPPEKDAILAQFLEALKYRVPGSRPPGT